MGKEGQKKSVLVVDVDEDLRTSTSVRLKAAGFEVHEAKDGEESLEQIRKILPDLVLMDIKMPKLNGMQAFFRLKEIPGVSKIKIVFLTNYGEPQAEAAWLDKKFAKEIGAAGYIRKTNRLDSLVEQVKDILSAAENPTA